MTGDLPGGRADPGSDPPQRPTSEQDQLTQIKARRAAVSPPPWRRGYSGIVDKVDVLVAEDDEMSRSDAEFIVHAPEDVDYLAGRVERLTGLLERLEWSGGFRCDYAACPDCERLPSEGHADGCELAAAIGAPREATP